MQRAPRGDADPIRADWLAVGEKNGDADVRHRVGGIEDARGLVRDQGRLVKRALRRNISFGNSPMLASDDFHCRSCVILRYRVMPRRFGPGRNETTSNTAIGSTVGTFF